jgi:hypothetical protein
LADPVHKRGGVRIIPSNVALRMSAIQDIPEAVAQSELFYPNLPFATPQHYARERV